MTFLSISKYEAMLKIAELSNITKAAEALGYSQSALSSIVAGLESEWSLKLLVREKYGVRLTPEGEHILPYLKRIVEEHREMEREITRLQKLERGTIRLGAFQSAYSHLLPRILKSFTTRYPQISFEFKQTNYHEIERLVHDGQLDCGFVTLPTSLSMKTVPIYRDRVLAVFPPGTQSRQNPFPIREVQNENLIAQTEFDTEILELFKRYDIRLDKKYSSDHEYAILPMVASGVGMCILPELILRNTPYDLVVRELDPPAFRTIALAYRESSLSPATKKFIAHVKEEFRLL